MKIRINRKVIGHFLEYCWIFIIAIGIFSYTIFYYPIHKINEYKSYEKIVFFSAAGYVIEKDFSKNILEEFGDTILKIDVYDYSSKDELLGTLYESFGAKADFLILSETDLKTMQQYVKNNFLTLDDKFISNNFEDYEYFIYDESKFGLKVYDHENQIYNENHKFSEWIDFDGNDNYYLLTNIKSVNFNLKEEKKKSDNGYKVFNYLLERYGI